MTRTLGLLLAAGAGRRMGTPKGLLRDAAGVPFVDRAVGALLEGGCDRVAVVVGAAGDEVTELLRNAGWLDDPEVDVVTADDWDEGMGASLRAGLEHAAGGPSERVVVSLVDLPDVGAPVVARLLARLPATGAAGPQALARAAYDGRPGHPVVIGRAHWAGVVGSAAGDKGARDYLAAHPPLLVECGDLAGGEDVDHPEQL